MFNPFEKPSQDEIDMREFITTPHYKKNIAPFLEKEFRDYQAHKQNELAKRNRSEVSEQTQTPIPQPPKDYRR